MIVVVVVIIVVVIVIISLLLLFIARNGLPEFLEFTVSIFSTTCVQRNMCTVQYVYSAICVQYNMCTVQYVYSTICVQCNMCTVQYVYSTIWTTGFKCVLSLFWERFSDLFTYFESLHRACRSQRPRGLRRGFAVARLLELWVRIPPQSWVSVVSAVCWSGRGPCFGLITRTEEFYWVWCVSVIVKPR